LKKSFLFSGGSIRQPNDKEIERQTNQPMKKLFVLLVVTMTATSMYGQGVSGGLKFGVNLANQKFESDGFSITPDGRTSFHAGLFLTTMVTENFGIQPELLYNSVGSKFDISGSDIVQKFNYLSVPIMFRYSPVQVFNLHAGPQFGILLSATQEFDGDSEDIEDVKTLDLGLGFGAGLDLPMGLTASLRYTLGLSNIADTDDDDATMKNNVFQISLGYKLFGAGD
jgi:hypothetical protein